MKTKKIKLDKIGSVLQNTGIKNTIEVSPVVKPIEGNALAVKVLTEDKKYGELELADLSMAKVNKGDILAGVLGKRSGLKGIVGEIPKSISPGDTLNILNIGGVLGKAESWNKDYVGKPMGVKVIGTIMNGDKQLTIKDYSIQIATKLKDTVPIVGIFGTAMDCGKTTVAKKIIRTLAQEEDLKVAGGKITGVAAQKDLAGMKESGAHKVLSFLDFGLPSTVDTDSVVQVAYGIINKLNDSLADVIVIEMGDGVIGRYGGEQLVQDKNFMQSISFKVLCGNDLLGVQAGIEMFNSLGYSVDFVSGAVSNNTAGTDYIEGKFNVPAEDIRHGKTKLSNALLIKILS